MEGVSVVVAQAMLAALTVSRAGAGASAAAGAAGEPVTNLSMESCQEKVGPC